MNFNFRGVQGLDVSIYQDDNSTPQQIDFVKMRSWGAQFVIVRAGQNVWSDPDFVYNWRQAKAAGIPRGAYWFYDPRVSPYEQARIFCVMVRDDRPEGRMWIDLEFPASWGGSFTGWQNWKTFIEEVKRLSGLRVGVYTATWWWQPNAVQKGADLAYFGQYPLWVAQYTSIPADVILPRGWSKAMIWQDGTPAIGREVGVESEEVDHNQWNSDFDFAVEWGATPPPIPEPEQPVKNKVTVIWDGGARERQDPHAAGVYGIILPDNSIHYSDFDPVPDMDDPTNTNKRWIKLQSGWHIACDYPNSAGVPSQRARVEPVAPPVDEIVVSVSAEITATINGQAYRGTALIDGVRLGAV